MVTAGSRAGACCLVAPHMWVLYTLELEQNQPEATAKVASPEVLPLV